MNITENELRALLAKMLPETVRYGSDGRIYWNGLDHGNSYVLDTELLALCSLVEAGLSDREYIAFAHALNEAWLRDTSLQSNRLTLCRSASATWHQRTSALAEVKGVTP